MDEQAPKSVPKRRWSRLTWIAVGVTLLAVLPLFVLTLNSTIPFRVNWVADEKSGTTYVHYWDGHTEAINGH